MRTLICIIFLISFSISAIAQETILEINTTRKYKFIFQLDNRFSSIREADITILGAKAGIQYKRLTRLGLGGSFILSPVNITYIDKKTGEISENTINFWYGSIFNDWILYKSHKLECFITEQIGYGKPHLTREVNDEIVNNINIPLYINEISGQANYRVLSWLGVGAGIGYRNIWNKHAALRSTFDAPIYIGKIIIYPETFLKRN